MNTLMEIVTIEARVFERMLKRLEDAAQITDDLCEKYSEKKLRKWMDNQEACILLGVTPEPYRPSETTEHWHTARSITKSTTDRKTYKTYFP